MCAQLTALISAFVRSEDGRTAVEYAIAVNLIVLLILAGINVSGHNGKKTVTVVCDRVGIAYQSTHDTLYSLARRSRSMMGASNAGRH